MISAAVQTTVSTGVGTLIAKPLGLHPYAGAVVGCTASITSLALKKIFSREQVIENYLSAPPQQKKPPTIKHGIYSTIAILAGAKLGQLVAVLYGRKTSVSYESSFVQACIVASLASKLSGRHLYSIVLSGAAGALIAQGMRVKPLLGFFIGNTTALIRMVMTQLPFLHPSQERDFTDALKERILKIFTTLASVKIAQLVIQRLGYNASLLQLYAVASISRKFSRPFGSFAGKQEIPEERERRGSSDSTVHIDAPPEGTAERR